MNASTRYDARFEKWWQSTEKAGRSPGYVEEKDVAWAAWEEATRIADGEREAALNRVGAAIEPQLEHDAAAREALVRENAELRRQLAAKA
jgi:hypothetical protein